MASAVAPPAGREAAAQGRRSSLVSLVVAEKPVRATGLEVRRGRELT